MLEKEARREGLQEGRQEERMEIARLLKGNGASNELIEKSTALTKEEIKQLN